MDTLKGKIKGLFSSIYFVVLFLFLTLVIFISISGNFRTYQSQISIIVIPKSPALSAQSENLVQNFEMLPKTLAFYNRVLKDNPEIKDQSKGLTDAERKEVWDKNLSIKREGNSQIIDITAYSQNNDANIIARQTVTSLFSLSAQYYNLKTDLDLRIIDGPINSSHVSLWFVPLAISLILGFILAFLISYILAGINKIFTRPNVSHLFRNIEDKFKFEKNPPLRLEDFGLSELESIKPKQETKKQEKSEEIKTSNKRSSAPVNLPIASQNFSINQESLFPKFGTEKIAPQQEKAPEAKKGEPTDEEIKKRLNKLLKGEL